ncbi:MAG: hypothetical protein E7578_02055 [Ruminococcaceae bacterium]|nr:hypothetical protein [Oscillospiraceae bacterium]
MTDLRKKHVYILIIMVFITFILTFLSETITSSVSATLELCQKSVIPSLFPFIVLSSIISKTAAHLIGDIRSDKVILIPFFLGALCGFPVGASSIALLYRNNVISKKKAEYFCALCNNTGPAFIIGVVGKEFWGSTAIGIMFYLCQILSAVICFAIWYCILGKRTFLSGGENHNIKKATANLPSANVDYSVCTTFCNSVTSAVSSVLYICGYIVFFKMLCDIIKSIISAYSGSRFLCSVIASALEFTSGAYAAAEIGGTVGIALCGFAIGFSGLSVIAQSASFLYSAGLSALPLLRLKILIGVLSSVLCSFFYNILELSENIIETSEPVFSESPLSLTALLICIAALLIRIFLFFKNLFKSHIIE